MAQESSQTMRVVPSGQIYRQLFDAQLQLNQSLSYLDSKTRIQRLKSKKLPYSQSLPSLAQHQEDNNTVFKAQQKTWIEGVPNDPYTENPVLYKQYNDFCNQKLEEVKLSEAKSEVESLPDVVVSAKQGSDIVQRIDTSRRQRHESTLQDFYQALCVISNDIEPLAKELNTTLINKLASDDEEIAKLLNKIKKDKDLLTYKCPDLFALWEDIQAHTTTRKTWINELNSNLQKIEIARMNKVRDVFAEYGKKFKAISYLMLPDLQRLMDKESQKINQTVLCNHRCYADLNVRLHAMNIEREKFQHINFMKRVEDWKDLHIKIFVDNFKEFMKTPEVMQPLGIQAIIKKLLSDARFLNAQRIQIIEMLSTMKPPTSTVTKVETCREDLRKLNEEIDGVTQMYMSQIYQEYEQVCQDCLKKVDDLKESMIDAGMCSDQKANSVIDDHMLPLVGKQQRIYEDTLENMQNKIEDQRISVEQMVNILLEYAQQCAELWDMHDTNLKNVEVNFQNYLNKSRDDYDVIFQEKEANLDMVMDRMRQESSELGLKECLVKALEMLDKIKDSYEDFYDKQTHNVQTYPAVVNKELVSYEKCVCDFFSVSKLHAEMKPDVQSLNNKEKDESTVQKESDRTPVNENNAQDDEFDKVLADEVIEIASEERPISPEVSKTPVKEILRTTKGTEYYVVKEIEDYQYIDEKEKSLEQESTVSSFEVTFLTEVKDENVKVDLQDIDIQHITQSIGISSSLMWETKNAIRLQFLEHLDDWLEEAPLRANSIVVAKCEELNSELDLKLHLHMPRPRRAELDVHNVRAAEIVLHIERMTRQHSGMEHCLKNLQSQFKDMSLEHTKLANKYREDIEEIELSFAIATKPSKLEKLQIQVSVELEKFMSKIRTSLRQFRHHLDETLQTLRESNARFMKSIRLFSEGGNFSPEEVTICRQKLSKISVMIDNAEESIMSELEGMESKHLENATKIVANFEDRLKIHMNDLTYIESITHWLSFTQVKIKSEVSKSNTQAQNIDQMLNDLQSKISACESSSMDKEQIPATIFNDTLASIFEAFIKRRQYLNCGKTSSSADGNDQTGALKVGNETVAEKEAQGKIGLVQDGKSSKPTNDPAAAIIKNIFKAQAIKKEFTLNAEQLDKGDLAMGKKLIVAQTSVGGSDPGKSALKGADTTKEVAPKKSVSGRLNKGNNSDKKSLFITEKFEYFSDVKQDEHFMSAIQHTLKDASDAINATSEVFYTQKGTRVITRPQTIPETFDQCVEIMGQKIQHYFHQSEVYYNQCLLDFNGQISRLEQMCACVPGLVINELVKKEIQHSLDTQCQLSDRFNYIISNFTTNQKLVENKLRTTLGHPQYVDALNALCALEKTQCNDYLVAIEQHIKKRQEYAVEDAGIFLDHLVKAMQQQLQMYDNMLTADDVLNGRLEPKQDPLCKVLRNHVTERPLQNQESKIALAQGQTSWIGVPSNQFVIGDKPETLEVAPVVYTTKASPAHFSTVKARDKAYDEYKEYFDKCLDQIEATRQKLTITATNWNRSWEISVQKVTNLYKNE